MAQSFYWRSIMPLILSYDNYYSEQMNFLERYLRSVPSEQDQQRLQRVSKKQALQKIYFLEDLLQIDLESALEAMKISPYRTHKRPSDLNRDHVTQLEHSYSLNRPLNRHKLIYGPIDFYLEHLPESPSELNVITACPPDLSCSSELDLEEFSSGSGRKKQLKTEAYANECLKIATFIAGTAKNQGNTRLVISNFGLGLNISQLDSISKETAKKLMYQAFAQAAINHQIHIDWIVLSSEFTPIQASKQLAQYAPGNEFIAPIIHDDPIKYTSMLSSRKEKVALLNSGNDLYVGGEYTRKHPRTLEGQITQLSDLLLLHTTLNQSMVDQFKTLFDQQKHALSNSKAIKDKSYTEHHDPLITIPTNSCLNQQQLTEITALVKILNKEKNRMWSLNKDRKQVKVNALIVLIRESGNFNSVNQLADYILDEFPYANKGLISNRTGELLARLKEHDSTIQLSTMPHKK